MFCELSTCLWYCQPYMLNLDDRESQEAAVVLNTMFKFVVCLHSGNRITMCLNAMFV